MLIPISDVLISVSKVLTFLVVVVLWTEMSVNRSDITSHSVVSLSRWQCLSVSLSVFLFACLLPLCLSLCLCVACQSFHLCLFVSDRHCLLFIISTSVYSMVCWGFIAEL